jgi:hypothetical protein
LSEYTAEIIGIIVQRTRIMEEQMNTPNQTSNTEKRRWHTPEAYILRGAEAGSGTRTPGARESTKGRGFSESSGYNVSPNPLMPS